MLQQLRFHAFRPDFASAFKAINVEWLNEMFEVEASDLATLDHPQAILDHDGQIYFAELMNTARPDDLSAPSDPVNLYQIVGCVALKRILPPLAEPAEGLFELTKMGVFQRARDRKVGEPLLLHALEQATTLPQIKRLFLLTSTKCKAAIHLYEKHGWLHDTTMLERFRHVYRRADVGMIYPPVCVV